MMGGQVQVVSADLGEIKGFVESGDIRVLAVLSDQPVSAFPDLPTAKSQGYDVTGYTLAYQMGIKFDRILDGFEAPTERLSDLVAPPTGSVKGSGSAGWR